MRQIAISLHDGAQVPQVRWYENFYGAPFVCSVATRAVYDQALISYGISFPQKLPADCFWLNCTTGNDNVFRCKRVGMSADISGRCIIVNVTDNESVVVRNGDMLFRLCSTEPFEFVVVDVRLTMPLTLNRRSAVEEDSDDLDGADDDAIRRTRTAAENTIQRRFYASKEIGAADAEKRYA